MEGGINAPLRELPRNYRGLSQGLPLICTCQNNSIQPRLFKTIIYAGLAITCGEHLVVVHELSMRAGKSLKNTSFCMYSTSVSGMEEHKLSTLR